MGIAESESAAQVKKNYNILPRVTRYVVRERAFMLTWPFGFKFFRGGAQERGAPVGVMPGPWVYLPDNQEYFKELELVEHGYYELKLYDEEGNGQGTGLWQVTHMVIWSKRRKRGFGWKDA